MFQNRVLRGVFEPERNEVTSDWRRLLSGELYVLHCWPNVVEVSVEINRTLGDVCTEWWLGELREGLFERTKHRWDDNIEIGLQEMGWSRNIDWIFLVEDREKLWDAVSSVMNIWISNSVGNYLTNWGYISFWERFCSTQSVSCLLHNKLFIHT